MKTKWYEESPGVTSSKRLIGGTLLAVGACMKLVIFLFALFVPLGDAATATEHADGLMYIGGGLVGITGLDVFKHG